MTEPWSSRNQENLSTRPKIEKNKGDSRAMSMGSMNGLVYDENGKADYRDVTVFVGGPSPTSKSH